jgi:hypothetical protein
VFLHDPRLLIPEFKVKQTKNARQATASKDTFYWPDQNREDVSNILDAQGLPDANQPYNIPLSFANAIVAIDNNKLANQGNFKAPLIHSLTHLCLPLS